MKEIDPSVLYARLASAIFGIEVYLKSNGKMRLSRNVTPTLLRKVASEYTGKIYGRGKPGMTEALADLTAIRDNVKAQLAADKAAKNP